MRGTRFAYILALVAAIIGFLLLVQFVRLAMG